MGDRYLDERSIRAEAEAWARVQRQLVVFNWILTAATAVGGAAIVLSALG